MRARRTKQRLSEWPYLEWDIEKMNSFTEPKRSVALRKMRNKVHTNLVRDISRYREVARELAGHRRLIAGEAPVFTEIHGAVALKHNHLSNEFANLHIIDDLLAKRPDLFGL